MGWGEDLRAWIPAGQFGQALYAFDTIDSTNTVAARLAQAGAPEGTVVAADHQTRGRGRAGARWQSVPGTGIAISLVLRPSIAHPLRWTGLGAVAVVDALRLEGLSGSIKWPNDVLLEGRKAAGVLAEAAWDGEQPRFLILGIGVNVNRGSVPPGGLSAPATCLEDHLSRPVDRLRVYAAIVRAVEAWYPRLATADFVAAWETVLAYKGRRVRVEDDDRRIEGRLVGLGADGEARLVLDDGTEVRCGATARALRLAERSPG